MESLDLRLLFLDLNYKAIFLAFFELALIGFIKILFLGHWVHIISLNCADDVLAAGLNFSLVLFVFLVLDSLLGSHSEIFCLADSVIGIKGSDSFFSQVVVSEGAPVGKGDLLLNVPMVLQIELNFPIFFRVFVGVLLESDRLDCDFEDPIDDLKRGKEDFTIEIEFEDFFDNEFDFAFFLVLTGLNIELFVLILLLVISQLNGIIPGK